MSFSFVDLFAGIGGFHAVLGALGGRLGLAAELDEAAASVYSLNWRAEARADVTHLAGKSASRIPPHTVLAAGFPCQPFSKSGRQQGMLEDRGRLFDNVLKILAVHKPPMVILENVRNIAGPRQRQTWAALIGGLRNAGYRVSDIPCVFSPHLLSPALGGSPQHRDRVYIVGTYVGRRMAYIDRTIPPAVARRPVDGWDPRAWSLERDLLVDESTAKATGAYRVTGDERRWINAWNDFLACVGDIELPTFPMWSAYWHDGAQVDASAPEWKQVLESKNISFYTNNRRAIHRWLARNTDFRTFPASRQKFEWQAQDNTRDLWTCLLNFRPSGIRAKKPSYAPALVAMAQTPIVGSRDRRILPIEAARLQGFPDWFNFGGQRDSLTYKQLGNAIHVGAAYHVLRQHVLRDARELEAAGAHSLVAAVEDAPLVPVVEQPVNPLVAVA